MNVDTHIDAALERVRAERASAAAMRSALDAFAGRVADIDPDHSRGGRLATTGGTALRGDASTGRGCETVRTAFAETVHPHSVGDTAESEPLSETLRNELSASIAAALAPASEAVFSPELKRAVLSAVKRRRAEATAMCGALEREAASLSDAHDTVAEITGWICRADECPLTDLGFDALRRRHERLAAHREACSALVVARQSFLREHTRRASGVDIHRRRLVRSLYDDRPVDYPVLVTAARLDDTCRECQRVVRDHLTRRA